MANNHNTTAERDQTTEAFFGDATWPERIAVLDPSPLGEALPVLVVIVGADELDATMTRLIAARGAASDLATWQAGSRGVVSWATLAAPAGEHVKLRVQLTAPVDFAVSWLFDRAQTAGALQAVSAGCLVAIATPEQLDEIAGRSLADALNTLPTIAAPPLSAVAAKAAKQTGPPW